MTPRGKRWLAVCGLAIVGLLLAVVASFKLTGGRYYDPAWNTEAGLRTLRTQLHIYKEMTGVYPTTEQGLHALVEVPTSSPVPEHWQQLVFPDTIVDAWHRPFVYRFPGARDANSFELFSLGRDGLESEDDLRISP